MKKELVWNVYYHNIKKDKIEPYNIFQHGSFSKYLYKLKTEYLKKDNFRFEEFMEQVKKELVHYYRSKSEWEIVVSAWAGGKAEEKIDIYDQILNNWEAFKEYLYNNYKLIKKPS